MCGKVYSAAKKMHKKFGELWETTRLVVTIKNDESRHLWLTDKASVPTAVAVNNGGKFCHKVATMAN